MTASLNIYFVYILLYDTPRAEFPDNDNTAIPLVFPKNALTVTWTCENVFYVLLKSRCPFVKYNFIRNRILNVLTQ